MGRKTWDSLPDPVRPLPRGQCYVENTGWNADGAITALYAGRAIEVAFAEVKNAGLLAVPKFTRFLWIGH